MPHYRIDDFIRCCSQNPGKVIVLLGPERDAAYYFGLKPKARIIDFIGNGGLEGLTFINTKPWDHNKDKSIELLVDAYEFLTLKKIGYIAFIFSPKSKTWIIKSFHLSNKDPSKILLGLGNPKLIGP